MLAIGFAMCDTIMPMTKTDKTGDLLKILSRAFSYPEAELYGAMGDGGLLSLLKEAAGKLDLSGLEQGIAQTLKTRTHEQLCTEYIALFDINAERPPLHLYGGLYGNDRVKTLQRLMKLYQQHGLELAQGSEEADHLTVQLEFLAFLLDQGKNTGPMTDELAWAKKIAKDLEARGGHPFYSPLADLLSETLETI